MAALCPVLRRLLALRAAHSPLRRHYSTLGSHLSTWHKFPSTFNTKTSASLQRVHRNGGVLGMCHKADWHYKSNFRGLTQREVIVVSLSLGTFLLYFMCLREPNDIDEYLNQPIWKRLPGIDPEQAQRMMEVDKYLGLQVDYTELEKYKQEYYAKKLEELHDEQQQRKKHQELLQKTTSHRMMLENFSQNKPSK
ncbi:uncharacterized protein LOC126998336 isoform X1 [Eriocheir sinensis]|uniref:uncharacterized protein LOC126998336 isoform X1 n=1 Tax=Eriocheir sinensis TaxID=95602 RepID=UPI0021C59ABE|nr:uncharacterized protein LOC126998336 isoform X1 [Eriocheir sinensis]